MSATPSRLLHTVLLVTLSLLTPLMLSAQQPDTISLKPVVVTATRLPMPLTTLSVSVTVLDAATLSRGGVTSVADALRSIPAAAVVQSGSFGAQTSVFLRGGESDYTKVLLNGVPVNQPGGAFDFAGLTTDNLERVEVLRGPASVLYGSDAVTGVVQLFTRDRRQPGMPALTLGTRGGTYGTLESYASAVGGSARLGWSVGGSWATTDGTLLSTPDGSSRSGSRVDCPCGRTTGSCATTIHRTIPVTRWGSITTFTAAIFRIGAERTRTRTCISPRVPS